jgi:putative transposase
MGRRKRIIIPGWSHHITHRGNHRQRVFYSDHDRQIYLSLLDKYLAHHELNLIGYSLMDNHVHLLIIPKKKNSLSDGIRNLQRDFARWQNLQHNRIGHLWEDRFFSCPVDEESVWKVLSYIELNRVRAGLIEKAWDWDWCSASAHITGSDSSGLLDMDLWKKYFNGASWKAFLEQALLDKSTPQNIRKATNRGQPLASIKVIKKLEQELAIPILPRKKGRKRG